MRLGLGLGLVYCTVRADSWIASGIDILSCHHILDYSPALRSLDKLLLTVPRMALALSESVQR